MIEIEAKIKLKNRNELISKDVLQSKSKDHVLDIYFDKNDELKSEDKVLRLRKQNDTAYIAFKGPRLKDESLHVREEYEPAISDFELGKKIIELLGFTPVQMVEKTREAFILDGVCDVKIELDHYPFIGFYLEIEGERDSVLEVMKKLDYSMEEATTKNCTELFFEHLVKENINLANPQLQFTFEDEKNLI